MPGIDSFKAAATANPDARLSLERNNDTQVKTSGFKGKAVSFMKREYGSNNVKVKQAFVSALRSEYGDALADFAATSIDAQSRKPLSGRQVMQFIQRGDAQKAFATQSKADAAAAKAAFQQEVKQANQSLEESLTNPQSALLTNLRNTALRQRRIVGDPANFQHAVRDAVPDIKADLQQLKKGLTADQRIPMQQAINAATARIDAAVQQAARQDGFALRQTSQEMTNHQVAARTFGPAVANARNATLAAINSRQADFDARVGDTNTVRGDLALRQQMVRDGIDQILDDARVSTLSDVVPGSLSKLSTASKNLSPGPERDALATLTSAELREVVAEMLGAQSDESRVKDVAIAISGSVPMGVSDAAANAIRTAARSDAASMLGRTTITDHGVAAPQPLSRNDVAGLIQGSGVNTVNPGMTDFHALRNHVAGLPADSPLVDELAMASAEELQALISEFLQPPAGSSIARDFRVAMLGGLPNRADDTTTIHLGGKRYSQQKVLGEGSYGTVHLFAAADGSTVVVKEPTINHSDYDDADLPAALASLRNAMKDEVRVHRHAMQEANPGDAANIATMYGPVCTPDGDILLVMETYEHGSVQNLWADNRLTKAAESGVLTQKAAGLIKAAMAKDLLTGMQQIQSRRNMVQLDLKGLNFFMNGQGSLKIGDFGLAASGLTTRIDKDFETTPLYQSPEIIGSIDRAKEVERKAKETAKAAVKDNAKSRTIPVARAFGQAKYDEALAAGADVQEAGRAGNAGTEAAYNAAYGPIYEDSHNATYGPAYAAAVNADPQSATARDDTFAAGVLLSELYSGFVKDFEVVDERGDVQPASSFRMHMEQERRDFANSGQMGIQARTTVAPGTAGAGASVVDRLINGLTNPDPNARLTFDAALNSSVFTDHDLDLPEVRELLPLMSDWANTQDDLAKLQKRRAPDVNELNRLQNDSQTLETQIKQKCDALGG